MDKENEILGFYFLSKEKKKCTLSGFWVLPAYMGKGIGRALFLHMIDTAKKLDASQIEWESDPNAAPFYLRMGALQISERTYILEGTERTLPILEIQVKTP